VTKLFAEYLKEADDNPANIIMSVAELIRKDMDADNEVAKTSVPFFLMQLRNAGLPISYSGLKAYYNAHPELKNVIQTFNDQDIIFVGQGDEADSETLGEPQGDIPPEEVVDNMAKRAMNKRMNELDDNMIEGKDEGASKEEEDEFHVALDDLVHKTFGHSSMEKKKKQPAVEDLLDQLDELDEEVNQEFDYWQSPTSLAKLAGVSERKLSKSEEGKREKYVKGMKKAKADFKDRYGKDAESVMYATATKMAKGEK
jgi:hypothetical protein